MVTDQVHSALLLVKFIDLRLSISSPNCTLSNAIEDVLISLLRKLYRDLVGDYLIRAVRSKPKITRMPKRQNTKRQK